MGNPAFLIDADACTNCGLCVVACKDEHAGAAHAPWTAPQPDTGQFWIDVRARERGATPRLRMTFLPVNCQHCGNAACIAVCPEDAIGRRDDGLVWIDPGACTGCGLCQPACPYDVIYMNEDAGIAQKCTGCAHRVDAGALPRCADACPHEAILYGAEAAAALENGGDGRAAEVFHPEFLAAPRVLWRGLPKPWMAGEIVDAASDEVVVGADVEVLDLFTGTPATAITDGFGEFWVRNLEPRRKYRVQVRHPGYGTETAVVTVEADCDLGTIALTPGS